MSETDWDAYKRQQEYELMDELDRQEKADLRGIAARAGRDWGARLGITPESRAEARAEALRKIDERRWRVPEPGVPGGGGREVVGARLTLEEAKLALSALSGSLESTEDAVRDAVYELAYTVGLGPRALLEDQQERDAEVDGGVDRLWEAAARAGEGRPS
jgi:hypothetical protein